MNTQTSTSHLTPVELTGQSDFNLSVAEDNPVPRVSFVYY